MTSALFTFIMSSSPFTIQNKTLSLQQVSAETNIIDSSTDCKLAMTAKSEDTSHIAFGEIWKRFHKGSHILYEPNIQGALDSARKLGTAAGGMHTLVTGSQHLVGGALYSLNEYTLGQGSG
jgi:folylpolyglutamate synthase